MKERFGDQVSIEWKAFLLRPDGDGGDPAKHEKFVDYTKSWARPAQAEPSLTFSIWSTDNPQPSGSIPPHVAAKAMAEFAPEADAAYHRRIMDAYFAENRTISDPQVLTQLAVEVGVDGDRFLEHVAGRQVALAQEAIDEHNEAIENGITAAPTVVLDGALPVPGAQDFVAYERWIERLLERRAGSSSTDS
ncbi:MAG: DsbA family protein [Actinomycetota bacterium]